MVTDTARWMPDSYVDTLLYNNINYIVSTVHTSRYNMLQ